MKKIFLMLIFCFCSISIWAQETLQSVTGRGNISIRDLSNITLQNANTGPGRLFIQFNNADGSRRGYLGYGSSSTNKFYINTDDGSSTVIQNKLLINNPPDIGTDGAQVKSGLSIYGTENNSGNHIVFKRSEGAEMAYIGWETETEANSPFVIKSSNGNDIKFMINDSEMMRVKAGNLSIGTPDAKGYKLAVNGKIRAHEIKIETANWPDYVFAKDYKLLSLMETERHIQEKGHLPGIPSADEAKANGVDLGDMNAKLLQKIEELTLYLIEQGKEIKELKKEVKSLKNN